MLTEEPGGPGLSDRAEVELEPLMVEPEPQTIDRIPPAAATEDDSTGGGEPGGRSSLLVNTFWSLAAEGLRLVSSLVTFLILTRLYDPVQFGILVATMGLFAFVFPQASVGAGWLVLKRVASEGWDTTEALARATGMVLVGGVVFGAVMLAIRPLLLPQASVAMFIGLGFTELFLVGMVEITLFAAQAKERLVVKAATWTTYGIGRAVSALILLLTLESPDLGPWIVANIIVAAVVLALAQYMTVGRLVAPRLPRPIDIRLGIPYSIGFGADRLREVTDTVTLVRFDYEADAGLYSAARRLVNVTQSPIIASLHAVNARLWRAGGRSTREARAIALRFSAVGVVYGVAVAAGLILVGGYLADLLDDSYAESGTVLVWLSVVPLLLALETFPAMALTASGYHGHRVVLTLLTGGLNLTLNLLWIPDNGWKAAVFATLVSSSVYVVSLWLTLNWAVGHDRRSQEVSRDRDQ